VHTHTHAHAHTHRSTHMQTLTCTYVHTHAWHVQALKLLYDANDMAAAALQSTSSLSSRANTSPVCFKEFYNDAVNNDDFNLKEDFRRWKSVSATK